MFGESQLKQEVLEQFVEEIVRIRILEILILSPSPLGGKSLVSSLFI